MFFLKMNKKTKEKVIGRIIRFDVENNKHYLVFEFETLNGQKMILRYKLKEADIEESSLEDVYIGSFVNEKLKEPLLIENIKIKYVVEDPSDFLPRRV